MYGKLIYDLYMVRHVFKKHEEIVEVVEIPELNSTKNKSKRDKLSEHVHSVT